MVDSTNGGKEWKAGAGWTIVWANGQRRWGNRKIFARNSLQAEMQAIWWSLNDLDSQANSVYLETDCEGAIKALREPKYARVDIKNLATNVRSILCSFQFCLCTKLRREQVVHTHNLAIKARKGL